MIWGAISRKIASATRGCLPAAVVLAGALSGCAAHNSAENEALGINDPNEPFNRHVHSFNKGFDELVLRPVAVGYDAVTPGLFRLLIRNALNHLELPRDFANHVLVADLPAAGRTLGRFGVNTLLGAGGFLDPASQVDLPKEDADFGRTLARGGFEEGPYYEIPLMGPSTVRHTMGRIVDLAFAPTSYVFEPFSGAIVTGIDAVETRADNMPAIDSVLYESADSYATTRAIYLQNRRNFVRDADYYGAERIDLFDEESSE